MVLFLRVIGATFCFIDDVEIDLLLLSVLNSCALLAHFFFIFFNVAHCRLSIIFMTVKMLLLSFNILMSVPRHFFFNFIVLYSDTIVTDVRERREGLLQSTSLVSYLIHYCIRFNCRKICREELLF